MDELNQNQEVQLTEDEQKLVAAGQRVRTTDDDSTKPTVTKPEGVPDKFWNAETGQVNTEALLKSYTELESKLGGQKQEETATETKQEDPAEKTETAPAAGFETFYQEFSQNGKLSEDSYKALAEKHGIPKEVVDAYIEGQTLRATYGEDQVLASVGGKETFSVMSQWAAANLSEKELNAFNAQVTHSVESAGMAVQWLKSKYEAANGKAPQLLQGRPASGAADGFATKSDMMAAMRDKRYGSDPDYTREVAQKMANRRFTM